MDSNLPRGAALILGLVSVLMGSLIVATTTGVLPAEGRLLAPVWVVGSAGGIFLVFGLLLLIPESKLEPLRALLGLGLLGMVAVVCNWSGFAPEAVYSTSGSISLGPFSWQAQNGGGARLVFAAAAIVVDLVLLYVIGAWLWSLTRDE